VDDTSDSDVGANGEAPAVTLGIGERVQDIDMGVEEPNRDPLPDDDSATTCYDEVVSVNVLENDVDPDGDILTITEVNGLAISEGGPALDIGGVLVSLQSGQLSFDGSIAYADLLTGQEMTDSFTYTVEDGNGGVASANVDVTFCGATDTLDKVKASLPATLTFQVVDEAYGSSSPEAYTLAISGTGDARFDQVFAEAYCLAAYDRALLGRSGTDIFDAPVITANVQVALADCVAPGVMAGQVGINGESAVDNLDLINWIINQDFGSQSNGDAPGGAYSTYTDAEVQGAIWALTDGQALAADGFGDANGLFVRDDLGTEANALEILQAALDNGEGFTPGQNDLVGVFLEPTSPDAHEQPFIVAIDLYEECIC
ncbi:MAG: hypothetical protein KDK91_20080, partial [Gammaproteobacteria bacterium]|nr:hypothetical protein [Gammaproteobacteria bacterium]